jgi:putative FmdB family regulatory protein
MPTYEYECKKCGEAVEIFHSMSEPARTKCPSCGKKGLKRLIGAGAGFIFKGSGFYITDYRSEAYKAKAKAESATKETKKSDDKASGGSSDSKSSSSSDAKASKAEKPSEKKSD